MAIGTVIRWGIPLSYIYCTIYQQDIWRQGDDRLIAEQKRIWRDFFTLLDNGYHMAVTKLNLNSEAEMVSQKIGFVAKFDSLDMRQCWNRKVMSTFSVVEEVTTNPKMIICRLGRLLQPQKNPHVEKNATSESN